MSGQQPGNEDHEPAAELEYQTQIGSKQFPEYPIRSTAEAYAQLRKPWGYLIPRWEALTLTLSNTANYITS